jgi:hypothetical protein
LERLEYYENSLKRLKIDNVNYVNLFRQHPQHHNDLLLNLNKNKPEKKTTHNHRKSINIDLEDEFENISLSSNKILSPKKSDHTNNDYYYNTNEIKLQINRHKKQNRFCLDDEITATLKPKSAIVTNNSKNCYKMKEKCKSVCFSIFLKLIYI